MWSTGSVVIALKEGIAWAKAAKSGKSRYEPEQMVQLAISGIVSEIYKCREESQKARREVLDGMASCWWW